MGHRTRLTAALAFAGAAVLLGGPLGDALRRFGRSWRHRVAVDGGSMEPSLRAGDWLIVDPEGFERRPPRAGDLVVVADPRLSDRWLVKRVAALTSDGQLDVRGDRPEASTDSRTFGPVAADTLIGRPWLRYWPPPRMGRLGRAAR